MVDVKQMVFPLMLVLLSFNSMYLFLTYLPANESQLFGDTAWRANTFGSVDSTGIQDTLNDVVSDTNGIRGQQLGFGTGTITERTLAAPLNDIIFGLGAGVAGCALGALAGGVIGCATAGIGLGLVGYFWKYFSVLAFGYIQWIDIFINPSWGAGFMWLGLGLKAFFFIIMMVGLLTFLLPIFSSWRK
jgi:hypothetical protein